MIAAAIGFAPATGVPIVTAPGYGKKLFPTTQWSEILRAGQQDALRDPEALGRLLRKYMPAMMIYLTRTRGCSEDQAEDMVQGFVLDKMILGQLIARADKQRGKFRTLLLTALNNYASNLRRRQRADDPSRRRGDDMTQIARDAPGPAHVYEVEWARRIVSEALKSMQDACRAAGRMDVWSVFVVRIVDPIFNNTQAPSYQRIVEQFGYENPAQACNILVTGKRMFARILRAIITEYVADEELVDEEINELWKILNASRA